MKASPKAIHIAKSLKSQPHEPKLVKEYAFANAINRTENKITKTQQYV